MRTLASADLHFSSLNMRETAKNRLFPVLLHGAGALPGQFQRPIHLIVAAKTLLESDQAPGCSGYEPHTQSQCSVRMPLNRYPAKWLASPSPPGIGSAPARAGRDPPFPAWSHLLGKPPLRMLARWPARWPIQVAAAQLTNQLHADRAAGLQDLYGAVLPQGPEMRNG